MTVVAEATATDATTLAPVLRQVVQELDPNMPAFDARTMENFYSQRAVKTPNIIAESGAGFGGMGLVLAMVGLYGLIAYAASHRSREIGIGMAIGADRLKVIRMVLQQGLVLGSIGVAIGLILSLFACRSLMSAIWIASFSQLNYSILPAVAAPLLLVTLVTTYAPARRASLIDPMRTLREE
jgi:putative ABC transport system permease protein